MIEQTPQVPDPLEKEKRVEPNAALTDKGTQSGAPSQKVPPVKRSHLSNPPAMSAGDLYRQGTLRRQMEISREL